MTNTRTTTIIIAAVSIIVGLAVTPLALVGLLLAWAYYQYKARQS